jgi:DNA-binding CsgD family transcriptional regulator
MDQAADDFVYAIYGAVLDPQQWNVAVARMAALADAPHAGLHDIDFAAGVVHREVLFGIEEAYNRRYMQEFASIDPRVPIALGTNKFGWLSDYEYFTEEFRNNDRFYREYIHAYGGGETLITSFAKEGSRMGTAVIIRDMPQQKAAEEARHRLDAVMPHLDRAVKLSRRFAAIVSEAILGQSVLDALNEPLACATSDGRLHRANLAFDRALKLGHVLSQKQGVLQLRIPALQAQFMRAVRECCRIAEGGTSDDPDAQFTIRVDKLTGLPSFITIAPLAALNLQSWAGRPCALIRIDEPVREPAPEQLVDALGLSAAEARLVSTLCGGGGTLAEAAERVGISLNTAKSELASAFSKTGAKRQSELVALVAALPGRR